MKYYESQTELNVPSEERYRLHCRVETLIQETYLGVLPERGVKRDRGLVPAYSFKIIPHGHKSSLLTVRSATPLNIKSEKEYEINLQPSQRVQLNLLCCTETNLNADGRTKVWDRTEMVECMVNPRLKRAGFATDDATVLLGDTERFSFLKSGHRYWFLDGVNVTATVTVKDPELAEKAIIEGISKKRAFGFGLVSWEIVD